MRDAMFGHAKLARPPWGWLILLAAAVNCGCSGINVSKAVSPLDFLLPGLHIQNDPPQPVIPASTNVLVCCGGGVSPPADR
jgi:hypothetical protein